MKGPAWTRADLATLRQMRCVECADYAVIAAALGRSESAIKGKLGVCKWTLPHQAFRESKRRHRRPRMPWQR